VVQNRFCLLVMVAVWMVATVAWSDQLPPSVAFFYGARPPVNELKAFDVVVIDPDSGLTPAGYGSGPSRLFAYVSVGEVTPERSYARQMNPGWLIGENKDWKSRVVDVSNTAWQTFFLDRVIEPLWQAGYRGFFLDTLDSHQLATNKAQTPRMEAGLVAVIRAVRQRHPEAKLILNRGFEIFERVKDITFAVAAESLYRNFSPATGSYGEVPPDDREWLTARLNAVKDAGVLAIAIDYVPPSRRDLARQTAEKIKTLGFVPWVTDKDLDGLGVGTVEVMPRTILGLYDGSEGGGDPFFSDLQRFAVMPLNYLGYTVKPHDVREPLPTGILAGRYAGVIVWPNSNRSGEQRGLKAWVLQRMAEGVPVVFLDRFGVPLDADFLSSLGLELLSADKIVPPFKAMVKDSRIGFEQQPLPDRNSFLPLRLSTGSSLLRIVSGNGVVSDAAAITPWGGYVLAPFVLAPLLGDQTAWVLDPFRFFKDALRLPDMPVPDTTTENGVRLLMSHVDGDGFENRAEWPGGRLAAEELRTQILERYRIPTTISLITSSFDPHGINPENAPRLEKIARSIFALPNVEGASHSFSHPFRWKPDQTDSGTQIWPTVEIPGYTFSLMAEIVDSLDYINRNLMPPGKKARIFQWTGNCVPGEEAVRMTYEAGVLNINGGDTNITQSIRTLTRVAPLGIAKGEWFQTFAPNQNENVYTNLWTGPFYGYQRVLETFTLTDLPRRLKPVDIYYHFYSATKEASLKALKQVHDWAIGQRLFAIHTSDYIEKVLDFNRTVIARDGTGWLVRNNGKLRELRISKSAGYPELAPETNISGFNDTGDSRYIHLLPGGEARVRLSAAAPSSPYLVSAGAYLEALERGAHGMKLTFKGYSPFRVRLGNTYGCRFSQGVPDSRNSTQNELEAALPEGSHALAIVCR
jgi:polysaccharide biosynthesis protein PelA